MNAATGAARKADALATLEAARETIILQARRALLRCLLEHGAATLDDVRSRLDTSGVNPTCLGCVPGPLARARIIRRTGYRTSARPEARARVVAVWTLADPDAALHWLCDHPEPLLVAETGGQLALPLGGG